MQLSRLAGLGYLERAADDSYRLSRLVLGEPEIVARSNRSSRGWLKRRRGRFHGDDDIHAR